MPDTLEIENAATRTSSPVRAPGRLRILAVVCTGLASVALLVRLTVRDAWLPFSTIYYAAPLPVLALMWALASLMWWRLRNRQRSRWCAGVSLGCVMATLCYGFAWGQIDRSAAVGHTYRLVFWNVSRGKWGLDNVFQEIRATHPDVLAIVEAIPRPYQQHAGDWPTAFPDYEFIHDIDEGQTLVACRGKILRKHVPELGGGCILKDCVVELSRGPTLHVLVVDIASNPFWSRAAALRELTNYVRGLADEPCIIAGDFNTPADSIHFQRLREICNHAVETSARGYKATWPLPVPVLQIDHVWGTHAIHFRHTQLKSTSTSDHKLIQCEIGF